MKIQVSKETLGGIPIWIIILSILFGLLILALVIFVLWKVHTQFNKIIKMHSDEAATAIKNILCLLPDSIIVATLSGQLAKSTCANQCGWTANCRPTPFP